MIYQQIALIKLARGARKLEKDGQWHPFGEDGAAYYRVVGKVMQRVRFSDGEDEDLLALFEEIRPFPGKLAREGFRAGVHIRIEDDHFTLHNIMFRAFFGWEAFAKAVAAFGGRLEFTGSNALEYRSTMDEFNEETLRHALICAKAVTTVAPQIAEDIKLGIPHSESEIIGLLKTAYTVIDEEIPVPKPKKSDRKRKDGPPPQATLFNEDA
ncbi:MAG: hypothetical protein CL946_11765 [Ectothiorhodospiraceae bacterium]|nr:hypothetical protein [Ectothiorhodospiraceae bacterium]